MTHEQQLEILMLLSALESWGFVEKHRLPDYLHDRLSNAIEMLAKGILK